MKTLTNSNFSKTSKVTRFLCITAVLFFITSCSDKGTSVVTSWTNDNYQNKTYKKILVLGVSENNSNRAEVESAIVKRLFEKDIPAVASLSLFPPQLQHAPVSEEKMIDAVKNNNIDGVLIISLLDIKREEKAVPATSYTTGPRYPYYRTPYYGHYSTMHRTVHTPGHTVRTKKFYLESNFYSVKSKELAWTLQSESINPENISDFAVQYSETIVSSMLDAKLFDRSK
ncbi:MAG: hypothetical protein JRJ65_14720 [Deltaproteobacteria bacterium]|nr:hypothetical protein [Deltaproteobacteria bacterium]